MSAKENHNSQPARIRGFAFLVPKIKPRHGFLFAFVTLNLWLVAAAKGECVRIIKKIEISGSAIRDHRVSDKTIRRHIASQVGHPLDLEIVDSDIRFIYWTIGNFETVKALTRCEGNSMVLIFQVDEASLDPPSQLPSTTTTEEVKKGSSI